MRIRPLQPTALILIVSMLHPTLAAVRGEHAEYIGGTIKTLKPGCQGILNLDDKKNLLFDCGKQARLLIPYGAIQSMEFGQKVGRRVGSTIALGVTTIGIVALPMLFSKKKNHFLTIMFTNDQAETEAVVLELAKGIVRTTVPVLEARTGKRVELEDLEHGGEGVSAKKEAASQAASATAGRDSALPEDAKASAPARPVTAPPAAKPMTNEDVMALKMAGFSDDFVIFKIKGAQANYKVDTDDILALKRSHLSEPVIQAMMTAGTTPAAQSPAPPASQHVAVVPPEDTTPSQPADPVAGAAAEAPKKGIFTKLKGAFSSPSEERKPAAPSPVEPALPPQLVLTPVTILSSPTGATIFVDGYPAGRTPAVVKLLPGQYKLTLKAGGFPEYSQQIIVEPGQIRSFGVALDGSK